MLYTVRTAGPLVQGADPAQALVSLQGGGPSVAVGDLVSVSDPPTQAAAGAYTQITDVHGNVGWVPTDSITLGPTGSTLLNFGLLGAAGFAAWWFLFRR